MSDNTAAEDRAVDAMSAKIREEYGAMVRSEWVRETFRLGLAAYNEIMNRPESTEDGTPHTTVTRNFDTPDTSTVDRVMEDDSAAPVDEGNSGVTQS